MRRFPNGAKCRDQYCASADQNRTDQGVFGERFTKDQGSKDGIEDESGLPPSIDISKTDNRHQKKAKTALTA